ncbi:hypothetical protein [Streptomyces sp. NPDC001652]|uniref:hypothetical protein n=1 Tax=Streptomyces sp. NPDC001652 TaxID=3154393 RepID=UPI003327B11A
MLRTIRRSTGAVVTWQRASRVGLSAQAMAVAKIATATLTLAGTDRVRDVIHNFTTDGFAAPYAKYQGGRPQTFHIARAARAVGIRLLHEAEEVKFRRGW